MVSEVHILGKLRISIEYNPLDHGGGISQIDIALSEYPDIHSSLQMFDSLDFNALSSTIPSLTATLRKRFREALMQYVFPNTYPLMAKNDRPGANDDKKKIINVGFGTDMEDLEDEIKNTLLDINQLLTNKDHNESAVGMNRFIIVLY